MPSWNDAAEFAKFLYDSSADVIRGESTDRTTAFRDSFNNFVSEFKNEPAAQRFISNTLKAPVTGRALFSPATPVGLGTRLGQAIGCQLGKAGVLPFDTSNCAQANLAPNQDAPSQSAQPGQPIFRPGTASGLLAGNPLNRYINVQYHLAFSAIPESAVKRIQPELVNQGKGCSAFVDDMQQKVRKDGSVTLASTGEVFRNQESVVTETQTTWVVPTEAQRTGFSVAITRNLERIKELEKERAEIERVIEKGDLTKSIAINGEISQRKREILRWRDGLKTHSEDKEVTGQKFVGDKSYYNIQALKFSNYMSPTPQNPLFSNFVGAEMTLVEPYGFQLHEDIKAIANNIGYRGIHQHRMVWRLDIWFSGYDPDNGRWVSQIPISPKANLETGCKGSIVSYYMTITGMEAKTTHEGTVYTINLSPAGAMALRPEEMFMEATSVEVGRDGTFGEFLKGLSAELAKMKKNQVKNVGVDSDEDFTIERIYEFIAPIELLKTPYTYVPGQGLEKNNSEDPADGFKIPFEKGSSILDAVQRALWDLRKVQDDFLANQPENAEFIVPRVRYTVRVNCIYEEKNQFINDYRRIRFQYIIEPHLSYKDFTVMANSQVLSTLSLQARLNRLKEMIAYGMVQRKYSYLFTSENTEVINLDLKFGVFYWKTMTQDDTNSAAYAAMAAILQAQKDEVNNDDKKQNAKKDKEVQKLATVLSTIQDEGRRKRAEKNLEDSLYRLFGFVPSSFIKPTEANLSLMSMALTPAQRAHLSKSANRSDSMQDGRINTKNLFLREFDDNLNNDLLEIDMEIRGDPIYFYSPYGNDSLNILEPLDAIRYSNTDTSANPDVNKLSVQPSVDKVFYLHILAPNQSDYMDPARELTTSKTTVIGGFYQIVKVDSVMDGGKFTQTVKAVKISNLNYLGENIGLFEPVPNSGGTGYGNTGRSTNG